MFHRYGTLFYRKAIAPFDARSAMAGFVRPVPGRLPRHYRQHRGERGVTHAREAPARVELFVAMDSGWLFAALRRTVARWRGSLGFVGTQTSHAGRHCRLWHFFLPRGAGEQRAGT